MKKIYTGLLLFIICIGVAFQSDAQCNLAGANYQGTAAGTGCGIVTGTTCAFYSEYTTFTGLTIGSTYSIVANASTPPAGPYNVNVYTSSTAGSAPLAFTSGAAYPITVSFTATTTTVYAKTFAPGCTSPATTCHTYTLQCTSCGTAAPATVQPATTAVAQGAVNAQVVRLDVQACGASSTVSDITFGTTGSTNPATDILTARVYYTTTTTFSTTTPFGTAVMNPNGSFTVTGSQVINANSNGYFFLVYDVSCTATVTNVIDAEVTSFILNGSATIPTPTNPTGTRAITSLYAPTRTDPNGTTAVQAGTVNTVAARALITGSATCPGTVTQINTTISGTNPSADILSAKLYYSTSSTFSLATSTIFGSAVANPAAGTLSFNGSQLLATGSNYFYLVYDVSCTATPANTINGDINSLVVGSTTITVTGTATAANAITALYAPTRTDPNGTTAVQAGTANTVAARTLISGSALCPGTVTQINTTISGTNPSADILSAKLYYSTSSTFSLATSALFGSAVANPTAGTLSFTGSQVLASGSNYFYLVFDVSCTATAINTINGDINSIVVDGNTISVTGTATAANAISALYAPTRTDPNGTTGIPVGSLNNQMARVLISGSSLCPASITQINATATGTPSDISNARMYYTTSTTFSTAVLFGTAIANPSGSISFTGTQALASGNNYFWLVYDISCGATLAATVNGDINTVYVDAAPFAVTGTATAANAIIAITNFTTVADGEWSNAATWVCGSVPLTNSSAVTIAHNITVSDAGNIAGSVTVNSGASLTVSGGALSLGVTGGGNILLTNNGTLSVNSGTLNINGRLLMNLLGVFNQTGGNINIDGNAAGVPANSVGSGIAIMDLNVSNLTSVNLTGGTLTLVDPHANTTASKTILVTGSTAGSLNVTAAHTIQFGNGTSIDAGGNATNGFRVDTWAATTGMPFGNVIVTGPTGTNRFVTGQYQQPVLGNLTVNSGGEMRTATVLINGNLLVNSGGIFTSTTSLGMLYAVFLNASSLVFTPSVNPQQISGTGTFRNLAGAQTAELTSFLVDNSNASGVTISTPLRISGTFTMTSGRINTDAVNLLTLGYNITNAGTLTYTAGNIVGPFKRWITAATGARQFPMGDGTNLKNADINFTIVPATAGSLTARWSTTPPAAPEPVLTEGAITVDKTSTQGSWFIDAGDALAGGTYTGTFTANGSTDIVDYTKTVLIKRPTAGGAWTLDGIHVTTTGSNTAPVLQRTNMTGFSEFAIGGQALVVVPIAIDYFRGSKLAGTNYLDWKVSCTGEPSVRLILERSADGRRFTAIQDQTATATRCLQGFNYTDASPFAGINYYRLKMVTPDGAFRYSVIVTLLNQTKGFELISLAPNPVKTNAILSLTSVKGGKMNVSVSDISGKVVMTQSVTVIAGNNPVNMNFAALGAGTYNITVVNAENDMKTTRFVKY